MHTSYEQRLEFLHQFLEGAEVFHTNITNGALIKGDGWEVSSSGSRFAMLNQAIIQTSRKEALDELLAAIASTSNPCDIRLVGPAIKHLVCHRLLPLNTLLIMWSTSAKLQALTMLESVLTLMVPPIFRWG